MSPEVRLILFVLLSLMVYPIYNVKVLLFALFTSTVLFFLLKTPVRYLKGLIYANTFMFFIVGTLLLFDFKNNLHTAAVIFLKANTLLMLTFALVLPLGIVRLVRTLRKFSVPEKFTLMVLLAYRYIYSLREEYEKLKKAASLRGFEPGFNLRTYKTYGYLLGALTLKTYFKARQVYKAMLCRGFGG